MIKKRLRNFLFWIVVKINLFPNKLFIKNLFKLYEFSQLTKLIKFEKSDIILDLGCGSGLQTLLLGEKVQKVIGVDVDKKSIDFCNKMMKYIGKRINAEFICIPLEKSSFPNNYFDKIFSFSVIEHISNYKEVMAKVYQILKPGGYFIFSTDALETITPKLVEQHKANHLVEKYFTAEEMFILLTDLGFKEIKITKLFKSDYAKSLFEKGILNSFNYKFLNPFSYLRLINEENKTTNSNGIFLQILCRK